MIWTWLSEILYSYWLLKDNNHEESKEEKTDSVYDPYKDDEPIDPSIDEESRFEKSYKYTFGKKK